MSTLNTAGPAATGWCTSVVHLFCAGCSVVVKWWHPTRWPHGGVWPTAWHRCKALCLRYELLQLWLWLHFTLTFQSATKQITAACGMARSDACKAGEVQTAGNTTVFWASCTAWVKRVINRVPCLHCLDICAHSRQMWLSNPVCFVPCDVCQCRRSFCSLAWSCWSKRPVNKLM